MHGQTELSVIGVLVVLDAVLRDDVAQSAAVDSKQQRAQHKSLWNTDVERNSVRLMLSHLNEMCSVDDVRPQPRQRCVGHSELGMQAFDQ